MLTSERKFIPEGTTEPLLYVLTAKDREDPDAERLPIDGTGCEVELVITRNTAAGVEEDVETPPEAAWDDPTVGKVTVTGVGALSRGQYFVRFKVTDGAAQVVFFPEDEPRLVWRVGR